MVWFLTAIQATITPAWGGHYKTIVNQLEGSDFQPIFVEHFHKEKQCFRTDSGFVLADENLQVLLGLSFNPQRRMSKYRPCWHRWNIALIDYEALIIEDEDFHRNLLSALGYFNVDETSTGMEQPVISETAVERFLQEPWLKEWPSPRAVQRFSGEWEWVASNLPTVASEYERLLQMPDFEDSNKDTWRSTVDAVLLPFQALIETYHQNFHNSYSWLWVTTMKGAGLYTRSHNFSPNAELSNHFYNSTHAVYVGMDEAPRWELPIYDLEKNRQSSTLYGGRDNVLIIHRSNPLYLEPIFELIDSRLAEWKAEHYVPAIRQLNDMASTLRQQESDLQNSQRYCYLPKHPDYESDATRYSINTARQILLHCQGYVRLVNDPALPPELVSYKTHPDFPQIQAEALRLEQNMDAIVAAEAQRLAALERTKTWCTSNADVSKSTQKYLQCMSNVDLSQQARRYAATNRDLYTNHMSTASLNCARNSGGLTVLRKWLQTCSEVNMGCSHTKSSFSGVYRGDYGSNSLCATVERHISR